MTPAQIQATKDAARAAIPGAFSALRRHLEGVRSAAIDVQQTLAAAGNLGDPSDTLPMVDAMLCSETVEHASAASLLLVNELPRHQNTVELFKAIAEKCGPKTVDAFCDAWERGATDASLSCPCNKCPTCKARDRARKAHPGYLPGQDPAPAAVLAVLVSEVEESAIVGLDGKPLQAGAGPQIVVPK